ncbi:MAG: RNA polymerase sigma factor [Clostridia bacterium]|nr:RNA polymerase sigma factor [Clostridia bacterium]
MIVIFALSDEKRADKNKRIEDLLASIADGNPDPMGELYDLIKTDVFAFALSKTANKHDADDILHDTFIQIYRYAKQYVPKGKPMAWIVTIELNLIRRRFNLASRTTSLDDAFATPSGFDLENSVVNNAFLQGILSTLSEEEREIISLHIVSGLKHREIAKILGKPLSTVLSKYNRAIKKLQIVVKEELYE